MTDATRSLPPGGFPVVFGHQLVGELPGVRPPAVPRRHDGRPLAALRGPAGRAASRGRPPRRHDRARRARGARSRRLPHANAIIGLGGGQAIDVAKFFAWTRRLPLFQVPTATTVNAPFGHRSGVRDHGRVRYLGWAIPEAVYIDFDVIASAPPNLNRSGVGDVLCYHTARFDWELADRLGRTEARWPYDQRLVDDAATVMGSVIDALDEIRDGQRGGDPGPRPRQSLGRDDVPRLRLEPAPHRGRGPLRLLQPRADHRPPLHPRPAGRPRDRRRVRPPGQRARGGWPPRSPGPASTSGRRRWASPGTTWREALRTLGRYVREVDLWFSRRRHRDGR